jgi:Fe-S-cluster-containing dehydrogenase component/DMSO reductase anchor subunit
MRKGFIFDSNRCVSCNACSAACVLENGWSVHPRMVYTYNSDALTSLPVINLSLACNHCETAVCLEGCPSGAYLREPYTGAVIIDELKCIGCKYCQWNCPYDAPKFDTIKRVIGKCNLCYSGLTEGRLPACTIACPTGALGYGEISEQTKGKILKWFPDKSLNPAIEFSSRGNINPLRIIPESIYSDNITVSSDNTSGLKSEWSLLAFSFLSIISVSGIISSLFKGIFPDKTLTVLLIIFAGLLSLFHLGRKEKAWRAFINLKTSMLSREIACFIVYSILTAIAVFFQLPLLLGIACITGLLLLILIDSVYARIDNNRQVFIHSSQTFLSALLITSFFTGFILPFIFIAAIKLLSAIYKISINRRNGIVFMMRFIRIAFLIATGASLITDISYPDPYIVFLFLTGEFLDRLMFYIDLDPLNINTLIIKQTNADQNEKKRS